ncbi:MAG: PilZ domain-containing protein [Myxococcaceae bacterium]|nr:PilZ domain-containing protein [Myxococcaceae bacterium]
MAAHSASILPLLTPPKPKARDRRDRSDAALVGLYARLSAGQPERRKFRERRATPRVPVELECEEVNGDSRYVRLTTDLSTFGMSTRHGPTPATGSRLALKLFLPDEPMAPLKLNAHVLGSYDTGGGMRLKFLKPSLDAVRRIHKFLTLRPAVAAL